MLSGGSVSTSVGPPDGVPTVQQPHSVPLGRSLSPVPVRRLLRRRHSVCFSSLCCLRHGTRLRSSRSAAVADGMHAAAGRVYRSIPVASRGSAHILRSLPLARPHVRAERGVQAPSATVSVSVGHSDYLAVAANVSQQLCGRSAGCRHCSGSGVCDLAGTLDRQPH